MYKECTKAAGEKMDKTIAVVKRDLSTLRAGRANPAVLDKLTVDYYGVPTAVNQMASVTVAEARMLMIQPYDVSSLKNIEKAIQASDIGINPTNDGRVIRLVFPQLTEERRRELAKQVKKLAEDSKIALRVIRREALEKFKKMQKNSEITEDDLSNLDSEVQKLIDDKCNDIDEVEKVKEKEIMEI